MRFSGRGGSSHWTGAKVGLGFGSGVRVGSATAVGSGRGVSVGLLEHPVISDSVRRIKISFRTFIPAILPANQVFKLWNVIFFMGNEQTYLPTYPR